MTNLLIQVRRSWQWSWEWIKALKKRTMLSSRKNHVLLILHPGDQGSFNRMINPASGRPNDKTASTPTGSHENPHTLSLWWETVLGTCMSQDIISQTCARLIYPMDDMIIKFIKWKWIQIRWIGIGLYLSILITLTPFKGLKRSWELLEGMLVTCFSWYWLIMQDDDVNECFDTTETNKRLILNAPFMTLQGRPLIITPSTRPVSRLY